jgi:hypothetical protein
MSLWQFAAAVGGWAKANSPDEGGLNREEAEASAAALKALRPDLR